MAKQSVSFKPRGFSFGAFPFVNATGTTVSTVKAAGANDSIVKSLIITSDDSSPMDVSIILYDGSNSRILDTINVPAGSGTNGTDPAVDALASTALPLDS